MPIRILKNHVLAVEIRAGLYILAQSLGNNTLVFFNHFTAYPMEFIVALTKEDALCVITPTKSFFAKSNIIRLKNIKPIDNLDEITQYRTKPKLFSRNNGSQKYLLEFGSKGTIEVLLLHRSSDGVRLVTPEIQTIKLLYLPQNLDDILHYTLDTMGTYGELQERLYLSYLFGNSTFIEPQKHLVLNRKPPDEFETYFKILSGRYTEDEWKQLRTSAPDTVRGKQILQLDKAPIANYILFL